MSKNFGLGANVFGKQVRWMYGAELIEIDIGKTGMKQIWNMGVGKCEGAPNNTEPSALLTTQRGALRRPNS